MAPLALKKANKILHKRLERNGPNDEDRKRYEKNSGHKLDESKWNKYHENSKNLHNGR